MDDLNQALPSRKASAARIIGFVSLIAWLIPLIGIPLSMLGLVLGGLGLQAANRKAAMLGMGLCVFTLLLGLINAVVGAYQSIQGDHALVNKVLYKDSPIGAQKLIKINKARQGFSISIPESWKQIDAPHPSITLTVQSPATSPVDVYRETILIGVDLNPEIQTLEEYFQLSMQSIVLNTMEYRQEANGLEDINGMTFRWAVYTQRVKRMQIRSKIYITRRGPKYCYIVLHAFSESFAEYEVLFSTIMASFELKE